MQSEQQYSNLIYEYFFMRIQFGYYHCGDYLPSIDNLCREFCVSAQTVKIALQRLRAEGYIDMHNGRSTKVIFEQDPERARQAMIRYFSRRIQGFEDLYQSTRLIIMPLMLEGFHQAGPEALDGLSRLAAGNSADDVLQFFCFLLQQIDNPLAMNLYWETSIYWGLLFLKQGGEKDLSDIPLMHEGMRRCIELARAKDWCRLYGQLRDFRQISVGNALEKLAGSILPSADEEQIPFVWRIYRDRPQVCYSLASRLLHEIYVGGFREDSYLPSYEKLSEQFGVSVSTVRRTVKTLNQLGAAQSINGKGTRIFGIGEPCRVPDLKSPSVRRNLAYFFQAFELVAYSCEAVMRDTLDAAAPGEKRKLLSQLEEAIETGNTDLTLWQCLLFMANHSRLHGVRTVYKNIYGLFLWGYPLKASLVNGPEPIPSILRFTESTVKHLRENDTEGCVNALKTVVAQRFSTAEGYLLRCGLQPEELRLTPSIRLLITDENT